MTIPKLLTKGRPLFFLLCLTLIFFYPFILFGKIPMPSDLIVGGYFPWLDYKWGNQIGVGVKNPFLSDVVSLIYPLKLATVELIKKGEFPYWNSHLFGGYPLIANFQVGLFFPTMLFYFFFQSAVAWTLQVMFQPFLASVFMYLFLRDLNLSKSSSLFGGIIYGFGGFSLIWLEWNVLVATSAFFPLMLLFVNKFLREPKAKWGVGLSLAIGLSLFAGYPQVSAFSLFGLSLYTLIKKPNLRELLSLGFYGFLGVGLASVILLPGFELFGLSQRRWENSEASFIYLPLQYLITFLAPDYFGNYSTGNFYGLGDYTKVTIYSGTLGFVLALRGVISCFKHKEVKIFLALLVVCLLLTLKNPLSSFLYFQGLWGGGGGSTTRINFLINFFLAGLAAFGLESLKKNLGKMIFLVTGILILLVLIALLTFQYNPHSKIALNNLIFPTALILMTLGILTVKKYLFKWEYFLEWSLILLLIFELFRFGWKFNDFSNLNYLYPQTPITSFLLSQKGERVNTTPVIPANFWIPYGLESFSGYDAVYPLTTSKFIAALNSQNPNSVQNGRFGFVENYQSPLFPLTSTRYLLGFVKNKESFKNFQEVYQDKSVGVWENNQGLPRAFLVPKTQETTQEKALSDLFKVKDFKELALVEKRSNLDNGGKGSANLINISNNHFRVETDNSKDSFLVVLNSFYPGWEDFIDGQKTQVVKTDYAFMGVKVPAGVHRIDFWYVPKAFIAGVWISGLSFLLLIVIWFIPQPKSFKK